MIYPKFFFEDKQNKNKNEGDENTSSICVIMPFANQFTDVYNKGIKSLARKMELDCVRADEIFRSKPIMEDILRYIYKSQIIIADTTGRNPNVFYELGISHTTKEFVIIISQSLDDVPFDLRHLRCFLYSPTNEGIKHLQLVLFKALLVVLLEISTQGNDALQKVNNKNEKVFKKRGQANPSAGIVQTVQKEMEQYCDVVNNIRETVSLSTLSKSIKKYHKAHTYLIKNLSKLYKQLIKINEQI